MDKKQIEELMKLMQVHGFSELEIEQGKEKLKLVREAPPYPQPHSFPSAYPPAPFMAPQSPAPSPEPLNSDPAKQESKSKYREIRSPFVGTFYASASPGGDPFVTVGKRIKQGDTLCIVEAMKLMNEIEADFGGTIAKIMIQNEEPIEYDQVLFLVE